MNEIFHFKNCVAARITNWHPLLFFKNILLSIQVGKALLSGNEVEIKEGLHHS